MVLPLLPLLPLAKGTPRAGNTKITGNTPNSAANPVFFTAGEFGLPPAGSLLLSKINEPAHSP
jgi:hypothetical protein